MVGRHEGHVAQYLGDGVVIYFGFPSAHEDDAQRAVHCGLDILTAMAEWNRRSTRSDGVVLHVRAGAHTGRVVIAAVGAGDGKQDLAQGDPPNIASRVQDMADVDGLAVSDATWRLVQDYYRRVARRGRAEGHRAADGAVARHGGQRSAVRLEVRQVDCARRRRREPGRSKRSGRR